MAFHTNDPTICLLTQHITSRRPLKTSQGSQGNAKQIKSRLEIDDKNIETFARCYLSAVKIPDRLLERIIQGCSVDEEFLKRFAEHIIDNKLTFQFSISKKYQREILKKMIAELEKKCPCVPDNFYDKLGDAMSENDIDKTSTFRVYLTEKMDKVLALVEESPVQLSKGTTGLSVWQASCDLANLSRILPFENKTIIELGAGCGLSGISIGALHPTSTVYMTDFDKNVLEQLKKNVALNVRENGCCENVKVQAIDWCNFDKKAKKPWIDMNGADYIVASDVVYDPDLLNSLCKVIEFFLRLRPGSSAIFASTRRDEMTLLSFRKFLDQNNMRIAEEVMYQSDGLIAKVHTGELLIKEFDSIFPFSTSILAPTIFHHIVLK